MPCRHLTLCSHLLSYLTSLLYGFDYLELLTILATSIQSSLNGVKHRDENGWKVWLFLPKIVFLLRKQKTLKTCLSVSMITIGLPSAIQHQMATRLTVVVGYTFLTPGLPRSGLHMVAVTCMLMKLNEEESDNKDTGWNREPQPSNPSLYALPVDNKYGGQLHSARLWTTGDDSARELQWFCPPSLFHTMPCRKTQGDWRLTQQLSLKSKRRHKSSLLAVYPKGVFASFQMKMLNRRFGGTSSNSTSGK